MSFEHPHVLWSLFVPLALALWTWRRESGRLVLPFDHGHPGSGWGWRWLINAASTLPPLLLCLAIVLAAGPQCYGEPQQKRSLTNIEFCLDVSRSMTAPLGDGSRYDAALQAAEEFLKYRQGDAFGLTFFGSSVLHWVPLTSEASAFRCAPPFMRPEQLPLWFGGTEIGKALRACRKVLEEREEGDRMIVLITDGMSADLAGGNDEQIARELKAANIAVFAIIIGQAGVSGDMATITSLTGGEAYTADDPAALDTVFHHIDVMKQARLEKTLGDTIDDFRPWCLASLIGLVLHSLASWGLRYTPW
ncbi:MAG TPA: vWA domain-containing protein [Pirellulales bacterium]|jgi:Ca-activated chloride channel family protein|nr:vWA domain-containing protein [Pirellulales bacterium]